jgi:hypothetical protein
MAYFAEIDVNNIVTRVLKIDDDQEHRGQEFLSQDLGLGGRWIQTSFNTRAGVHLEGKTPLRKNFAGVGMYYDEQNDAFCGIKKYESWILNPQTCLYEAPVPKPEDGDYAWDDQAGYWREIVFNESSQQWDFI